MFVRVSAVSGMKPSGWIGSPKVPPTGIVLESVLLA